NRGIELFRPLVEGIPTWQDLSPDQVAVLIEFIFATKFLMQANLMQANDLEAIQVRGLSIARQQQDEQAILKCLRAIVKLIRHPNRQEETETYLHEAIALARKTRNDQLLAKLLLNQALIDYDFHTNRVKSLQVNQEVIAITRRTGDQRRLAKALSNAAVTQLADGKWDAVRQSLQDAEQIARQIGDIQSLLFNLSLQRDLALFLMHREQAIALQDELTNIEQQLNVPWRQFTYNYRQFFWLFLQEDYEQGLHLWRETENLHPEQSPYPMTNIPHGALYAGMLSDFDAYFEGIRSGLYRAIHRSDVPRVIYLSVPLLKLHQERQEWLPCTRLLGSMLNHPHTWELVRQHPYIERLTQELGEQLGADAFQAAWEQGYSLAFIPAIIEQYPQLKLSV
ncbi:MAG: hypothetical protein KC496_08605, partial [Anaerolineae bacterium]|nr:hypothetical protein [Anaerolineae bacterium]